jgi:hypothetical protein
MRWDRHTLTEFGGIAAVVVGALLFEDAGAAFVPVIGMVGGVAAMALGTGLRPLPGAGQSRAAQAENRVAGNAPGAGGVDTAGSTAPVKFRFWKSPVRLPARVTVRGFIEGI